MAVDPTPTTSFIAPVLHYLHNGKGSLKLRCREEAGSRRREAQLQAVKTLSKLHQGRISTVKSEEPPGYPYSLGDEEQK